MTRSSRSDGATGEASATCSARHGYPASAIARMLVRPAVGALASLVRLDTTASALPRGDARRARVRPALRPLAPLTRLELGEERGVAVEPVVEREPLDRPASRSLRVALAVGEDRADGRRRAPPASAARRARSRRDAARRLPPRRRRARPCRRSRRTRRAAPHASASITVVGHGSLTFVWRRTCARRKTSGASDCVYRPTRSIAPPSPSRSTVGPGSETSRPLTSRRAPGCGVEHEPEGLERELEPVRLGLVAAEEHDRAVRRDGPRRETARRRRRSEGSPTSRAARRGSRRPTAC